MRTRSDVVGCITLLVGGAALALPWTLAAQEADNEAKGASALKTLTTAEADFRANDRDGNLCNDFWTGDVYALYGLVPVPGGQFKPPEDTDDAAAIIKLIEPAVAGADAASALGEYGNLRPKEAFKASKTREGAPYHGYVFRAFARQDDGAGATDLRNDTDGKEYYGKVHDRCRFAFVAAPEKLDSGKQLFIVNADNTIWRFALPKTYSMTFVPIGPHQESTSNLKAGSKEFDDAAVYPQAPGAAGCVHAD